MKKGLNEAEITRVAAELIAEKGYDRFSLRELAARLGVRPASLYHHVDGIGGINVALALEAAQQMNARLREAGEGLEREPAFLAGVAAYRAFAAENPELYKALFHIPVEQDELVRRAAIHSIRPLRETVCLFLSEPEHLTNFMRGLRATLHGFVSLSEVGFLLRGGVPRDESYSVIAQTLLKLLLELEAAEKNTEEREEDAT